MLLLAAERLAVLESLLPSLTFQPGPPSFSKRAPSQRMTYFVKDHHGLFNVLKIESVIEWKKLSFHNLGVKLIIEPWSNRIKAEPERSPIDDPTGKRSPRVVLFNVLKIGPMTEPKKLPIHDLTDDRITVKSD